MKRWLRPMSFEIGRDKAVHMASPSTDDLADWINGVNVQGTLRPARMSCTAPRKIGQNPDKIQPVRDKGISMKQWWAILIIIVTGVLLVILANRHLQQLLSSAFNAHAPSHSEAKNALIAVIVALLVVALIVEFIRQIGVSHSSRDVDEPLNGLESVSDVNELNDKSFVSLILVTAIIWGLKFKIKQDANIIHTIRSGLPTAENRLSNRVSAVFVGPHIDLSRLDKDGRTILDGV